MTSPRVTKGATSVVVRGGVRTRGGLLGVTQTMSFSVQEGETVDFSVSLQREG